MTNLLYHADYALLQRCAKRDAAAERLLYSTYRNRLMRFIRVRVWDEQEATTLMHETLLTAIGHTADNNEHQYKGVSKLSTFLLGIANNNVKNFQKHLPKLQFVDAEDLLETTEGSGNILDLLIAGERIESILICVDKLSPDMREVLVLTTFENVSVIEASEILGVKEGTVKSRLWYGRQGVEKCLGRTSSPFYKERIRG